MGIQEFFDRASNLSLKDLVIEGIESDVAIKSRQALLHSTLLSNLIPEIRKGVIFLQILSSEFPILKCVLLEKKACRSVSLSTHEC